MPATLKPNPAVAGSVTTAIEPLFLNKKQIAHAFSVSERSVDYWREKGFLPYIRIGGTIRFDLKQCREAIEKRFSHHEEGELWAPGSQGRRSWKKNKTTT